MTQEVNIDAIVWEFSESVRLRSDKLVDQLVKVLSPQGSITEEVDFTVPRNFEFVVDGAPLLKDGRVSLCANVCVPWSQHPLKLVPTDGRVTIDQMLTLVDAELSRIYKDHPETRGLTDEVHAAIKHTRQLLRGKGNDPIPRRITVLPEPIVVKSWWRRLIGR